MRVPSDPISMNIGRQLLKKLLPKAKEVCENNSFDTDIQPTSGLGDVSMEYMTEDNLDAVLVYEQPSGCWYADIVLKTVPRGIANVMGTPANMPLSSRDEAIAQAESLLVTILMMDRQRKSRPGSNHDTSRRIFVLYNLEFMIPASLVDILGKFADSDPDFPKVLAIRNRLDTLVMVNMSNTFSEVSFRSLPLEIQHQFVAVMAMGLARGVVRHPDTIAGRPN